MSEMPSQSYTLFDIPEPQMKLVHVHPGAEELGRVYHPHLAINAAPTAFCAALEGLQPPNADRLARTRPTPRMPTISPGREKATPVPGAVNLGEIMVWLRENLPPDAILTQRRRQFLRLGASLLSRAQIRQPCRRRPPARWAMACRPRWR